MSPRARRASEPTRAARRTASGAAGSARTLIGFGFASLRGVLRLDFAGGAASETQKFAGSRNGQEGVITRRIDRRRKRGRVGPVGIARAFPLGLKTIVGSSGTASFVVSPWRTVLEL